MVGWSDGRMVGKYVEKISNGVSSTGTQIRYANNKKRTRKNSDKTSNGAGLSGAKKVRKMRKFRYENCAERNGQKCAVFSEYEARRDKAYRFIYRCEL